MDAERQSLPFLPISELNTGKYVGTWYSTVLYVVRASMYPRRFPSSITITCPACYEYCKSCGLHPMGGYYVHETTDHEVAALTGKAWQTVFRGMRRLYSVPRACRAVQFSVDPKQARLLSFANAVDPDLETLSALSPTTARLLVDGRLEQGMIYHAAVLPLVSPRTGRIVLYARFPEPDMQAVERLLGPELIRAVASVPKRFELLHGMLVTRDITLPLLVKWGDISFGDAKRLVELMIRAQVVKLRAGIIYRHHVLSSLFLYFYGHNRSREEEVDEGDEPETEIEE